MHFGYKSYVIKLYGIRSLKEKRSISKRLQNELKKSFNASVIESGKHDSKNWLEISAGMIANSKGELESLFQCIEKRISENGFDIIEVTTEIW
ncbi:MAG: DUF503 domain-containing protein [Thermotogae bacterium]|uniref:DUF503 domain-containing protein n=1 Tax=Kosmotoga sp. TaxID=1955248 RepID=UPI000F25E583|nr:DUF503 domain-containing protein [Kosmotoga sp.]MBO8165652.1 DUF503 domain-containing protein [Kosmotoga sp.]MCD6159910.1 DUF503 domain-containing protein [Kosmotoga sp.]RKX50838.1 MAG: DUF503 domain-containing protein [Thermotogota bacterium]